MKPLLVKELPKFLSRFNNFIDGEIREIQTISPTTIKIIVAGQDSARGYDWLTVEFNFFDVSDASLIENQKLQHIDMENGINISYENSQFHFKISNSTLQIKSANIKYQEGIF